MWCVYIVECRDGSSYTGLTRDVESRLKSHSEGTGARHLKLKRPFKLRYIEQFETRIKAFKRETEIKKFNRSYKVNLIR